MKRLIILLLAVSLLAGCSDKKKAKADPTVETTGWYDGSSQVEIDTAGAVRSYFLQTGTVTEIIAFGENILLIEKDQAVKLTVLEKEQGSVISQFVLPEGFSNIQVIYNALAYYRSDTKEAVFLDYTLQTINTIKLPDEAEGTPLFAPDSSEIYYCVGQEIRAYNTSMNISRPVRSHSCTTQSLTGIYFDGAVIRCDLQMDDGTKAVYYVATENGELLSKDQNILSLETSQDSYIALRMDGVIRQQITGILTGDPVNVSVPNDVSVFPVPGGLVTCKVNDQGNTDVVLYNTTTGLKTAAITLNGIGTVSSVAADGKGVWLLTDLESSQILYYWNAESSAVADETVYTVPLYTANNPDKDGLKAAEKRAEDIARPYYVDIRIWEDALHTPDGYAVVGEYQTGAIEMVLNQLEPVLAQYPDRFLYRCTNGMLRINIVRSISGDLPALQFRGRTDPYIILTAGCNVAEEFHKAMGYVINSRVLAKSPLLDNWADLNPKDFVYGETNDESYLTGETRAFADEKSMASVTDDRSMLFYYAMQSDNAEMFQSSVMQSKLKQLCLGIRDAWSLEEKTETYPWEQYLTTPIAPQA